MFERLAPRALRYNITCQYSDRDIGPGQDVLHIKHHMFDVIRIVHGMFTMVGMVNVTLHRDRT